MYRDFYEVVSDRTIFFSDTLRTNSPYIARRPRDHESLFLVTSGALLYRHNEHSAVVHKGQVGYIAKGAVDWSGTFQCESVSYIATNFCFARDPAETPCVPIFPTVCSNKQTFDYSALFAAAHAAFAAKSPGYQAVCNGLLLQIIGQLYREQHTSAADLRAHRRLEKAMAHLRDRACCADFRVSELAELVQLSEKHFRRLFESVYGQKPFDFLQAYRINHARLLLQYTEKHIAAIADECGFSDVYGFSHCFKKHTHCSPSAYRAQFLYEKSPK